ncbi:hypothetical protein CAPTEDRAFT_214828 [Capitella teleta]|uniref:G-protein coupled receptors family 1 profile domain-containing protein n=1 Tax=Capitella teleta TaxID=283909 RepID=R7V807_CAPTE|nr:hypothetical protein CAPTEDRAFT_214828 [Capitella teleta]|eukprot:ELU12501.1 hypothetical protein CAPTEDRAFT_214828 [Capitella teleta]
MDNATLDPEAITSLVSLASAERAPYYSWYTGVMICGLVVLMAGIPGNLLTILAYFKYDQLHGPTNLLICSQSIGDLFTCLTGPIFAVLNYTVDGQALASSHKYLCLAGLGMVLAALQSSIFHILALGIERFIAVYFSLYYYNWVTDRNVKIAVVAIWTVVISINCLPIFGWTTWKPGVPCMTVNVYPQIFFQVLFIIPSMGCLLVCALGNFAIALTFYLLSLHKWAQNNIGNPYQFSPVIVRRLPTAANTNWFQVPATEDKSVRGRVHRNGRHLYLINRLRYIPLGRSNHVRANSDAGGRSTSPNIEPIHWEKFLHKFGK